MSKSWIRGEKELEVEPPGIARSTITGERYDVGQIVGFRELDVPLSEDVVVSVNEQLRTDGLEDPVDTRARDGRPRQRALWPAVRVVHEGLANGRNAPLGLRGVVGDEHVNGAGGDRRLDIGLARHLFGPPIDALGPQVPIDRCRAAERHEADAVDREPVTAWEHLEVVGELDRQGCAGV